MLELVVRFSGLPLSSRVVLETSCSLVSSLLYLSCFSLSLFLSLCRSDALSWQGRSRKVTDRGVKRLQPCHTPKIPSLLKSSAVSAGSEGGYLATIPWFPSQNYGSGSSGEICSRGGVRWQPSCWLLISPSRHLATEPAEGMASLTATSPLFLCAREGGVGGRKNGSL